MRATLAAATMLLALAAGLDADAAAQGPVRWRGGEGWGPGAHYGRMYDPKTVETVTGEVLRVEQMTPTKGMGPGIHLLLKTATETVSVHLGPSWYVEHQDTRIQPKDRIEVKGSRLSFDGKPAIIAAEVHKGDETLMLRDENGVPLWAGSRRRR
jgi:hypothetical protein